MKFDGDYAENVFSSMLSYDEKSLCPIYCTFRSTGFFAKPTRFAVGFATLTSCGRLLVAEQILNDCVKATFVLSTNKSCKIKKNLFGQYVVETTFPTQKKDIKLKLQAAPKVYGCNFPNQQHNLEYFLSIINNESPKII